MIRKFKIQTNPTHKNQETKSQLQAKERNGALLLEFEI
jgi:hypothetical protein